MIKEEIIQQILHLWRVEKLSKRQIAQQLGIDRGCVRKIIIGSGADPVVAIRKHNLDQFLGLIGQWYRQYPRLQALQVYRKLKDYGYTGCYESVKVMTRAYRQPPKTAYYPLTFNPGQEAQVDWFFFNHDLIGKVAGFLYVLSYSRYAWGMFYPRTGFEFFIAGHQVCYEHIKGVAREHRYDNLKSVVIRRYPHIQYNANFLDFARFYGFSIHACNPYSGHEKGRVERIIRDVRAFLVTSSFDNLDDLNKKFHCWLEERNSRVHRSTGRSPQDLLIEEKLMSLPENPYKSYRLTNARVSKTALIEFETNRYSVPTSCVEKLVDVHVYAGHIEVWLSGQRIARHARCFRRMEIIQNPLHAQRLFDQTPKFRARRVLEILIRMDLAYQTFLERQDEYEQTTVAWQIFELMRQYSRVQVLSAIRELNQTQTFKIKALMSRLNVPGVNELPKVWLKDPRLINIKYEERNLKEYDPDTGIV